MKNKQAILYALLAAFLYAFATPLSKIILSDLSPTFTAALFYLGAGFGMLIIRWIQPHKNSLTSKKLDKKSLPYLFGMVILDVIAPILFMIGLKTSNPENVSLLNNFEIVATTLIAILLFKEKTKKRLYLGILFITLSSILLTLQNDQAFSFSLGSIYTLLATITWGLENNLTRKLADYNPLSVVIIKGIGSGLIALIIAIILQATTMDIFKIILTLLIGFFTYGLSIFFYVSAQKDLGASKTSAYYAIAPFISVFLSIIIFQQWPQYLFYIAFVGMIIGMHFTTYD